LSVRDARFYHPTFRLNRPEEWLPIICRLARSKGSNADKSSAAPASAKPPG
jgi:hypothetical protein